MPPTRTAEGSLPDAAGWLAGRWSAGARQGQIEVQVDVFRSGVRMGKGTRWGCSECGSTGFTYAVKNRRLCSNGHPY